MLSRLLPFALLILVGCGQTDHSMDSVEGTIYSIDPNDESKGMWINSRRVLGKISILDAATKRKIIDKIAEGHKSPPEKSIACFQPPHIVKVKESDVLTTYMICFSCAKILKYVNDQEAGFGGFGSAPAAVINKVLKDANIPLAD